MLKHVIEVAVRKYYHIVVDDPEETMGKAEAAMVGLNIARMNPDLLIPIDGRYVDEADIEYAEHSGMIF